MQTNQINKFTFSDKNLSIDGNHHTFEGIFRSVTKESGSGYLSPCGGMGRGPWPLGRSILGDNGGRPGILLSRPMEKSESDACGTERADCNMMHLLFLDIL